MSDSVVQSNKFHAAIVIQYDVTVLLNNMHFIALDDTVLQFNRYELQCLMIRYLFNLCCKLQKVADSDINFLSPLERLSNGLFYLIGIPDMNTLLAMD